MFATVRRTNIYLSDDEIRAIDGAAAVSHSSRSDVIRRIIDREFNLGHSSELDAWLVEHSEELAARARALSADDPDLRIE